LIQIVEAGSGTVVWKLDYQGNVIVNPTSWTNGTVLGSTPGSSWTEAFIENNTNIYQQDLIQIVSTRGGGCLWKLDWTGTVYSVN
jgi:hypothetical protein